MVQARPARKTLAALLMILEGCFNSKIPILHVHVDHLLCAFAGMRKEKLVVPLEEIGDCQQYLGGKSDESRALDVDGAQKLWLCSVVELLHDSSDVVRIDQRGEVAGLVDVEERKWSIVRSLHRDFSP